MLQQGIEHSQASRGEVAPPEYALVYSAFALAQMAMDQGQADEAVRWLDDPAIGPMTLLSSGSPACGDLLTMADSTLLLAVLSYASARLPDKALDALARFENRALGRGDPLAGRQLARRYNLAGRRLRKVLLRLKQKGKADEVQQIAIGQELLLDRIAHAAVPLSLRERAGVRGSCKEPLRWQCRFGSSKPVWPWATMARVRRNRPRPPPICDGPCGPAWRSSIGSGQRRHGARRRPPRTSRSGWQPGCEPRDSAGRRWTGWPPCWLRRNLRIDAQVEAARTWQAWGREEPGCYLRAIRGDSYSWRMPGGASRQVPIWGWEEIARQLTPFPRYREQLLDACYNLAVCRTKLAATRTGISRGETLDKAAAEVAAIRLQLPSAGSVWAARFESLLKEIENARKVKVSGT